MQPIFQIACQLYSQQFYKTMKAKFKILICFTIMLILDWDMRVDIMITLWCNTHLLISSAYVIHLKK